MTSKTKVTLIPWDPQSLTHRQCLIRQRDECGWDQDKVEGIWKELQTKGYKCIYWIVSIFSESKMIYDNLPKYSPCKVKFRTNPFSLRFWL